MNRNFSAEHLLEVQSYCDTMYARGGACQMWILKISIDLFEYIYK
jgi:hypothetical protein